MIRLLTSECIFKMFVFPLTPNFFESFQCSSPLGKKERKGGGLFIDMFHVVFEWPLKDEVSDILSKIYAFVVRIFRGVGR